MYGGINRTIVKRLFIGTLAFDDESILTHVRLGVLVASLVPE
jgi:Na+/H+ antiporter NhaA